MNKTYRPDINMWSLDCDTNHILHKIGNPDYPAIRRTMVKPEEVELYEEIAVADIPPYTKTEYDNKVAEMVRQRYSESEEFAIQRKVINALLTPMTLSADTAESVMTEYAEYNTYVEQCKLDAPQTILDEKRQIAEGN